MLDMVAEEGEGSVRLVPIPEDPLKRLRRAVAREASKEGVCKSTIWKV